MIATDLVGCRGTQSGIKGQVRDFAFGLAGANITAAFAVRFGLGTAARFVAGQAVKLGIQATGGELGSG
jgi:hypothetical protein